MLASSIRLLYAEFYFVQSLISIGKLPFSSWSLNFNTFFWVSKRMINLLIECQPYARIISIELGNLHLCKVMIYLWLILIINIPTLSNYRIRRCHVPPKRPTLFQIHRATRQRGDYTKEGTGQRHGILKCCRIKKTQYWTTL